MMPDRIVHDQLAYEEELRRRRFRRTLARMDRWAVCGPVILLIMAIFSWATGEWPFQWMLP